MCEGPDTARLTELLLATGRKKILLADHTKLDKKGFVKYAQVDDFDLWITTPGIPEATLDELKERTQIIIAKV